jgi:hypothetical protein
MSDPAYRPGDLVEIALPDGLAYVHVLHRPPSYPFVVRILPGLHSRRPEAPARLLEREDGTVALVPLGEILARLGHASETVAQAPVSSAPRFRMAVRDRSGRVLYWWFWDGDTLSYTDDLAEAERALPLREITGAERFRALLEGRAD